MGYLFLSISLFAGIAKGYLGKITSNTASDSRKAMLISAVRMLFCIIIGLLLIVLSGEAGFLRVDFPALVICAVSGISTAGFVVCWLIAVRKSAYMMMDVFLTLGTLIPIIASSLMYGEQIKFTQWTGMVLLLIAVAIMCSYNNSFKEKITLSSLALLLTSGISNGITGLTQKMFVREYGEIPISVFNFYTYVFAFVFIAAILVFGRERADCREVADKKLITYVFLMAVCLFVNSYYGTVAARYLDSVKLFPLRSGVSLMLATGMSAVCFKEKITVKSIIGICLCFVSLVIINVL